MLKFANFSLVLVTLATASVLYNLEHSTRAQERSIAKAKTEMMDTAEAIKLLRAEWSSLTRPERIKMLAETQLGMVSIEPDQFVESKELETRLKALAVQDAPAAKGGIDDILKKMQ
jgi:cell division protein FtsL